MQIQSTQRVQTKISPRLLWLIGIFVMLNVGDLVSTWADLQAGLSEGNPLMNSLLFHQGFGALILYKLIVVGIVSSVALMLADSRPRMMAVTVFICNVMLFGAVVLNILQHPALI